MDVNLGGASNGVPRHPRFGAQRAISCESNGQTSLSFHQELLDHDHPHAFPLADPGRRRRIDLAQTGAEGDLPQGFERRLGLARVSAGACGTSARPWVRLRK